jgi:hypothetical protein
MESLKEKPYCRATEIKNVHSITFNEILLLDSTPRLSRTLQPLAPGGVRRDIKIQDFQNSGTNFDGPCQSHERGSNDRP